MRHSTLGKAELTAIVPLNEFGILRSRVWSSKFIRVPRLRHNWSRLVPPFLSAIGTSVRRTSFASALRAQSWSHHRPLQRDTARDVDLPQAAATCLIEQKAVTMACLLANHPGHLHPDGYRAPSHMSTKRHARVSVNSTSSLMRLRNQALFLGYPPGMRRLN